MEFIYIIVAIIVIILLIRFFSNSSKRSSQRNPSHSSDWIERERYRIKLEQILAEEGSEYQMGVKHRNQADQSFAEGKYSDAMAYYSYARERFERAGAWDEAARIEDQQALFYKRAGYADEPEVEDTPEDKPQKQ